MISRVFDKYLIRAEAGKLPQEWVKAGFDAWVRNTRFDDPVSISMRICIEP